MDAKGVEQPEERPGSGPSPLERPRPPADRGCSSFGIDPEARPGDVPWDARRALVGLLVAVAAVLVLATFLATVSPTGSSSKTTGGIGGAVAALVSTLIVDAWFVGVAWRTSLRRFRLPIASWGLRRCGLKALTPVPATLGVVYVASVAYNVVAHPPQQRVLTDFPRSGAGIALFTIMAIVVAPFFEELFFRGFLFQGLTSSFGPVPGAVVSSAIFALAHQQLSIFVPLFVLGLALAYVFYKTGAIWTNMALHASFNAIGVILWAALA